MICLHTAEVAGSNPASPTLERAFLQVKHKRLKQLPQVFRTFVQQRGKTNASEHADAPIVSAGKTI
jgi:hypothetical protein